MKNAFLALFLYLTYWLSATPAIANEAELDMREQKIDEKFEIIFVANPGIPGHAFMGFCRPGCGKAAYIGFYPDGALYLNRGFITSEVDTTVETANQERLRIFVSEKTFLEVLANAAKWTSTSESVPIDVLVEKWLSGDWPIERSTKSYNLTVNDCRHFIYEALHIISLVNIPTFDWRNLDTYRPEPNTSLGTPPAPLIPPYRYLGMIVKAANNFNEKTRTLEERKFSVSGFTDALDTSVFEYSPNPSYVLREIRDIGVASDDFIEDIFAEKPIGYGVLISNQSGYNKSRLRVDSFSPSSSNNALSAFLAVSSLTSFPEIGGVRDTEYANNSSKTPPLYLELSEDGFLIQRFGAEEWSEPAARAANHLIEEQTDLIWARRQAEERVESPIMREIARSDVAAMKKRQELANNAGRHSVDGDGTVNPALGGITGGLNATITMDENGLSFELIDINKMGIGVVEQAGSARNVEDRYSCRALNVLCYYD